MNAVIALCHFCELHGPSVLFCTQAFHNSDEADVTSKETGSGCMKKSWYGPPNLLQRSFQFSIGNQESSNAKSSDPCEGCSSMSENLRGFISNDHEAQVSYVSSQYPLHPEVFSVVRQACVRSISCEVCIGREGPIYFGDDHRGHVLSYTFFMKDSQARGFQSWYSIIVVMMDKIFLLNSWPFLVKHLQQIICELQEKASKVYEVEQSENSQRAIRLNSVTRMTPDNFRRQRGNAKARSVVELTSDKQVFPYLHLWFTWILRAGASRISERLVEGFPSEDTVIDLERQEETEEGFIKVHTKKVSVEYIPMMKSQEHSQKDVHVEDDCNDGPVVGCLGELIKHLSSDTFHILAYHTVIGNQIILQGQSKKLISSIITALKDLLPKGCYHPIYYSLIYEDSWKCNFLGLPLDVVVPEHVLASDLHICVKITKKENCAIKDLHSYNFTMHSIALLPDKMPQVLNEMERAIMNLTPSVLDSFLFTLKEIWMNKVKILFAFSRGGQRSVEDTAQLLQVLGAQEQDKQVLKFWMTGLSTKYKTRILSSSMQQGTGSSETAL